MVVIVAGVGVAGRLRGSNEALTRHTLREGEPLLDLQVVVNQSGRLRPVVVVVVQQVNGNSIKAMRAERLISAR